MGASTPKRDTKEELVHATIRLASRGGMEAASVRSITREAGVTEGALYRHYRSKEQLWVEVYTRIVEAMAEDKAVLLDADLPARERLGEWIRLTYAYYDGNRDAFNYVLLAPKSLADSLGEVYTRQGRLFTELFARLSAKGEVREMDPKLALALFAGIVLTVPRLVNEGGLEPLASGYTEEITDAVWRVLGT
ncbi:MAG: TetR/AcrR family transcriptional regulator [Planctomycetota bacterium]|nr:TetR/AcrR family transcriptional regulator [Planctomycetota bacterium]